MPPRSYSNNRLNFPSPLNIDQTRDIEASPRSWDSPASRDGLIASPASHDGLIASPSPPPRARTHMRDEPPPVPPHGGSSTTTSPIMTRSQRSGGVADGGLRRSGVYSGHRQNSVILDDED